MARVRRSNFIQVGLVTALLAYIFEVLYYGIVEGVLLNSIYVPISLILGGIIGAMFYRARTERERILARKPAEPEKKQ